MPPPRARRPVPSPPATPDKPERPAVDDRLVQQALKRIAKITRRATVDIVVEVGDHLVQGFFGGDLELARSNQANKPESLRAVLRRVAEVDADASMVRRSIRLSVQYRDLPATLASRLSLRQHFALLPVADKKEKARLGARALAEKLNAVALERLVRAEHGPALTGRKPKSELARALGAARRALLTAAIEAELPILKLRAIDPAVREEMEEAVRAVRERLERISDALMKAGR